MGRKLAFDRDKALHAAMENFWERGYEAASMRDLAQKLGLHLGSVYNALGPKEKVFEDALRLHYQTYQVPKLKQLREHPHPVKALMEVLETAAEECGDPQKFFGCFLFNSLPGITQINDNVSAFLRDYIRSKEDGFADCIGRGQEMGLIAAEKDARQLARFLVAVLFSMRALAKMGMPPEGIRDVKDCALKMIA